MINKKTMEELAEYDFDDVSTDVSLAQLQTEVAEWTAKNFPNAAPYHPLLGIQEEVGELSHAHLKMEQGIRGTAEEHHEAKVDAVADIIVYLADYCNRNGINMQNALTLTWHKVRQRDWTKNKKDGQIPTV